MSKINWNRLGFFVLGAFLGGPVIGFFLNAVKKV